MKLETIQHEDVEKSLLAHQHGGRTQQRHRTGI